MTALCSGKICTIFPEKGALNFWKACTIALEYSQAIDPSAQIRKSSRQIYFFEPGAIIEHCRALPKVFLEMNQMPVR